MVFILQTQFSSKTYKLPGSKGRGEDLVKEEALKVEEDEDVVAEVEETEGHQEMTRKDTGEKMIMREGYNQAWIICPSMTQAESGL